MECIFDCRGAAVDAIRQRAFLIIALAFADIENTENWEWFFRMLLCAGVLALLLADGKVSGNV